MAMTPKWKLSRAGYYVDLYLYPVLALLLAAWSHDQMHWWRSAFAGAAGWLLWHPTEYVVHRFLFHGPYRAEHWDHHRDPRAFIGVNTAITLALFGFGWLVSVGAAGPTGSLFWSGYMLGYVGYIWTHDAFHHRDPDTFGPRMRKLWLEHERHHERGSHANFGVQSRVFDHLFHTYEPSPIN